MLKPFIAAVIVFSVGFTGSQKMAVAGAKAALSCPPKETIEEVALKLVNEVRMQGQQCGGSYFEAATLVEWSGLIQRAAVEHSQSMASNNYFGHSGNDNSNPGQRLVENGYIWITYGENIAAGTSSTKETIETLLMSSGHCKNIMNPAFTEMALSCAMDSDSDYKLYWTQILAAPKTPNSSEPDEIEE